MFENKVVIYKFIQDLHFFVTGGEEENEVILATALQAFFDAVSLLLRYLVIICSLLLFSVFLMQFWCWYFLLWRNSGCVVVSICRGTVDKKEALENLDLILLCIDEVVDGGYAAFSLCSSHMCYPLIHFTGSIVRCLPCMPGIYLVLARGWKTERIGIFTWRNHGVCRLGLFTFFLGWKSSFTTLSMLLKNI